MYVSEVKELNFFNLCLLYISCCLHCSCFVHIIARNFTVKHTHVLISITIVLK